ncbi:MAG: pentapeptide repeat-containing protein, partial [Geitlerinemataceae cyanobacterium]
RDTDLQGANFLGAYLSGADLTGANLAGVSFSGADLRRASLTGAYLRRARLNNTQLDYADFRSADLTDAELEHVQSVTGADFFGVEGLDDATRANLCHRNDREIDTWNPLTRRTTRESLASW